MSHDLNLLKGGLYGDYIGKYYTYTVGVIQKDTRSLDYGSSGVDLLWCIGFSGPRHIATCW